jgi:hypothetical protein
VIQSGKIINSDVIESVVAEIITRESPEFKTVGKTDIEERRNLWNKIQEFDTEASAMDYYDNNEWNVEKMRSDLKVLLEKERFGR